MPRQNVNAARLCRGLDLTPVTLRTAQKRDGFNPERAGGDYTWVGQMQVAIVKHLGEFGISARRAGAVANNPDVAAVLNAIEPRPLGTGDLARWVASGEFTMRRLDAPRPVLLIQPGLYEEVPEDIEFADQKSPDLRVTVFKSRGEALAFLIDDPSVYGGWRSLLLDLGPMADALAEAIDCPRLGPKGFEQLKRSLENADGAESITRPNSPGLADCSD